MLDAIAAITLSVAAPEDTARAWQDWLGYKIVERGVVEAPLAASWGAAKAAGKPYILMMPGSGEPVVIRFVGGGPKPSELPPLSHGWTAIELLAEDTSLAAKMLARSPFRIVGKPEKLAPGSPVKAMQVRGPGGELIYLTNPGAARPRLGTPKSFIGRPFIMVVSGPLMQPLADYYGGLGLKVTPFGTLPVPVLADALKLPKDTGFTLSVARLKQQFLLELDDLPDAADDRPVKLGTLPGGISIVSVTVDRLDALPAPLLSPPVRRLEAPYNGRRTATARGPAGELIEFIESSR